MSLITFLEQQVSYYLKKVALLCLNVYVIKKAKCKQSSHLTFIQNNKSL
jgi:hypothetical protein